MVHTADKYSHCLGILQQRVLALPSGNTREDRVLQQEPPFLFHSVKILDGVEGHTSNIWCHQPTCGQYDNFIILAVDKVTMADTLQIVVLDGYTLNPGDLSWSGLEDIGEFKVHDRTPADETVSRATNAEIVLTNKTVLSREVLDQLPKVKYIGVLATGFNVVDGDAARERDIPVTNIPTYGTDSVAQMTFAHILSFTQRVNHHHQTVLDGRWGECPDFCYWDFPLVELAGLKMGVVGYGRIGRATAKLARAFGMQVLAYDAMQVTAEENDQIVDLTTLFREADVISLHCPLTPENNKLVNRERLSLMKPSALLVNTSRGPLIDSQALADALNEGQIAGAGLDVLEIEPPSAENPLFHADNCQITPHIAWATRSARSRLMDTAIENIVRFLEGQPQNVVNP